MTMGQTSEEVAARYGVTRQVQDQFSARSHDLADKAIKAGKFKEEIVPVTVKVRRLNVFQFISHTNASRVCVTDVELCSQVKDAKGEEKTVTVDTDEGSLPLTP